MATYEFDGNKYKKASLHQKEWGEKLIKEIVLKGFESILDLGCGDGMLTEKLARLVPKGNVVGIDASTGMIESAKKYKRKNLKYILLDINKMYFIEEFDIIISNATLHWIIDHDRLLRNCYSALKKGGEIRFNFAGKGNCLNFYAVIKKLLIDDKYVNYYRNFNWPWYMPNIMEYNKLLNTTNFQDIKIWGENADHLFPNENMMIKWIDQPSIVPFIKYLPEEKQKEFRNTVIKLMIKRTKQGDGSCLEVFRRINVSAKK